MQKLNIVLIKPPQETNEVQPPLGLGYLASAVKDDAEVTIIDSIKHSYSIKDVLNQVKNKNYDIIGLQCYTIDFNTVKTLVKYLKKLNPNSTIVLGGPHPTLTPIDTLENIQADYVFLGDSEASFQKFVSLFRQKN